LLIPFTQAGTYYLLVTTQYDYYGQQQVILKAEALPFSVIGLDPDTVGQGKVTTTVSGAGFRNNTEFLITDGNGIEITRASISSYNNSMGMELSWDLGSVPIGTYNIKAVNPDTTECSLNNGMVVIESTGLRLDIKETSPDH